MFRKKPKFYKNLSLRSRTLNVCPSGKPLSKRISVLLVLILFLSVVVFPPGPALAQEVNYCLDGTAEFNKIFIWFPDPSFSTWYDTAANINDDSESSYVGGEARSYTLQPDNNSSWVEYNAIVTFVEAKDINRVEYIYYGARNGVGDQYIKTYLYYGGGWNPIDTRSALMSKTTVTITSGAPWSDVTKVKIHVRIPNLRFNGWVRSFLYEIRAFGTALPVYQDIGLRVQTPTGIVSIAAEIGAPTSPLRIAKNGTIYGIVLVDPGDPNDSGVRIQTSSGIKALRRL